MPGKTAPPKPMNSTMAFSPNLADKKAQPRRIGVHQFNQSGNHVVVRLHGQEVS